MTEKFTDITDQFLEEIHVLIQCIDKIDVSSRGKLEELAHCILSMLDGLNACFRYDIEDILFDLQSKSKMFFLYERFSELKQCNAKNAD